jgi:hypothetical protein
MFVCILFSIQFCFHVGTGTPHRCGRLPVSNMLRFPVNCTLHAKPNKFTTETLRDVNNSTFNTFPVHYNNCKPYLLPDMDERCPGNSKSPKGRTLR